MGRRAAGKTSADMYTSAPTAESAPAARSEAEGLRAASPPVEVCGNLCFGPRDYLWGTVNADRRMTAEELITHRIEAYNMTGRELQSLRQHAGMGVTDAAIRVGVEPQEVTAWENEIDCYRLGFAARPTRAAANRIDRAIGRDRHEGHHKWKSEEDE